MWDNLKNTIVPEELLIIKLGGSLITDKSVFFKARKGVIYRLAGEIKSARDRYKGKMIIAHGSGSFGHAEAAKYKIKGGLTSKLAAEGLPFVASAAIKINRIFVEASLKAGLPVVSFAPMSFILSNNGMPKKAFVKPIEEAMVHNYIPVIYGDMVFDLKSGFSVYSSEKTVSILAQQFKDKFQKIKILFCGDTDGVYDENGKVIPEITSITFNQFSKNIKGSKNTDVTGGMLHKVEESINLAKITSINTFIINGQKKNNLTRAIIGEKMVGTLVKKVN